MVHDFLLRPRNGHTLNVLIVARISTVHQDIRSNDDQIAFCKAWLNERWDKDVNWHIIQSRGSGEHLDRRELTDAEDLVASDKLDLVIVEDLARICRRTRAFDFCELAEDHNVRLISINDHVDTTEDNWRLSAFFATMKHQFYNKDTSNRIKRTMRNRFMQGGVFQCPIYGYLKSPGAKSEADVHKDPGAESVYAEVFRKLESGASFGEIADWLNESGVKPGPHCRQAHWTGTMVGRITLNPILKGLRRRNVKEAKRLNKTGRSRSVNAPPGLLLTRECPHLAFIEPERYDRVILMIKKKNQKLARGRKRGAPDTRKGVSKKRTIWPGQHVVCGICNRLFYWGGHGVNEHMMCAGAREYVCWNGSTFDGLDAGRRLTTAILAEFETLRDFDAHFLDRIKTSFDKYLATQTVELGDVNRTLDATALQIQHVIDAIAKVGLNDSLEDKLRSLTAERDELHSKRLYLQREPQACLELPSIDQIKNEVKGAFGRLPITSPEFGRLMRKLIPSLKVFPFRLCDGGAVVLRAKLTLNLAALTKLPALDETRATLQRELLVDLFEPPQRECFRKQVIELRSEGLNVAQVGAKLGLTLTAVHRASALQRLMDEQNLTDPYVALAEPCAHGRKLRRHLHRRYRFEPLPNGTSI